MKLRHSIAFFKQVEKTTPLPASVAREWIYRRDDQEASVDTDQLDRVQLQAVYVHAKKNAAKDTLSATIVKRIDSYRKLLSDVEGTPIGKLERLATALIEYIRPTAHKYIFKEEQDGQMCPYYVTSIRYCPPNPQRETPASVSFRAKAIAFDGEESFSESWQTHNLVGGKTVVQLCTEAGIHRETPEAYEAYVKEVELYNQTVDQLGKQYRATGTAFNRSDRYGYGMISMERDGVKSRIIIDRRGDETEEAERDLQRSVSTTFWVKGADDESDNDDRDIDVIPIPVHPYVQAFDLGLHQYVGIHVNLIEPYVYDKTVAEKLVLPEQTKELINVLMESSAAMMEDIISGKTGGTVVIATGPPGTGKTLTAECYSEQIERPLYSVQCSQLGTDEESLEKKLLKTLARAGRWGAILLIDEADVYVRERGTDIQQNAIVGVFLRLLERYRGILFLTSNRATVIDDAILSRAIAHVRYEIPTPDELKRLWEVLSANYAVKLNAKDVDWLVKELPTISGRNVKNILKLATIRNRKLNKPVKAEDLTYVSKFIDLAKAE